MMTSMEWRSRVLGAVVLLAACGDGVDDDAAKADDGGTVVVNGGGTNECDCIACHSHEVPDRDGDGQPECECDPGYEWENPMDADDHSCTRIMTESLCNQPYHTQVGDSCFCIAGWEWCTDDPADLTCCEVGGGDGSGGGSGDSSGSGSGGSGTSA
jgi:hypothetical protein